MTEAQMNSNDDTLDSLDDTLDDLADLPATKPFVPGAHLLTVFPKRNPKKAGAYVVELVYKELIELTAVGDDDKIPKAGDKSTLFISTKKKDGTPNEFGQGQIKMILKPIGAMLGTASISEILEGSNGGVDCHVVTGIRKSKDPQYDDQQEIKAIQVA